MILRKTSIGVALLALASSASLAQASPTTHGKPESTPTQAHGKPPHTQTGPASKGPQGSQNSETGKGHGKPAKCQPHGVAYVASGTLVSDALTKNANGSYSGSLTVDVTHTNRHAATAKGSAQTYTVQDARVSGPLSVQTLVAGDRVKVIGEITAVAPKCVSSITPTITIDMLVFHTAARK